MPMELFLMYEQYPWILGDVVCDVKAVLTETFINCSILTIVSFSGERYLAICHPLSALSRASTKKTKRNILIIWIVSLFSASPWAWFTKVIWHFSQMAKIILNSDEESSFIMFRSIILSGKERC